MRSVCTHRDNGENRCPSNWLGVQICAVGWFSTALLSVWYSCYAVCNVMDMCSHFQLWSRWIRNTKEHGKNIWTSTRVQDFVVPVAELFQKIYVWSFFVDVTMSCSQPHYPLLQTRNPLLLFDQKVTWLRSNNENALEDFSFEQLLRITDFSFLFYYSPSWSIFCIVWSAFAGIMLIKKKKSHSHHTYEVWGILVQWLVLVVCGLKAHQ